MCAMDRAHVLEMLDVHRRATAIPGYRREDASETCRFIDADGARSLVLHSRLDEESAARVIAREIAHFRALGHRFEWKVFDHDGPADLRARLAAAGFTCGEPQAVLVLDLSSPPAALTAPVTSDVRRLTDPDGLGDMLDIWNDVWPEEDQSHWAAKVGRAMREQPGGVVPFVAYVGGAAVSTGRVVFAPGDPIAYLGGGATRAAFRGRGLYTDLLRVRVREALSRGARLLMADARPMSRPILEKHGFEFLEHAWPCEWRPPAVV